MLRLDAEASPRVYGLLLSRCAAGPGILAGVLGDHQTLLPAVGKLVVVVASAGLLGAGLGSVLAKVTGGEAPSVPAAVSGRPTDRSSVVNLATSQTTVASRIVTTLPAGAADRLPRVELLYAQLDPPSRTTGRTVLAVRIRLTNRTGRALHDRAATLLSGRDEVPVDAPASGTASPLRTLAAGATATATLRFTLPPRVARRLNTELAARLRIARRVVTLKLTKTSG